MDAMYPVADDYNLICSSLGRGSEERRVDCVDDVPPPDVSYRLVSTCNDADMQTKRSLIDVSELGRPEQAITHT